MDKHDALRLKRRDLLKWGGAALVGSAAGLRPTSAFGGTTSACDAEPACTEISVCSGGATEVLPTSPLIGGYVDSNGIVKGSAFTDELPLPRLLAPVSQSELMAGGFSAPGPGGGQQSSLVGSTHQIWPNQLGLPDPLFYRIKLEVAPHAFTSLMALPIDSNGNPVVPPPGAPQPANADGRLPLPPSTIYGYNGTFPGPMINAEYGRPCLVRFENNLGENPLSLDRGDFGSPECLRFPFLTHLHNGHTAPESDGNPNFNPHGYHAGQHVDNLYLNWPAGGDDREKQSFLWFHDHFEGYTGANVYKGLVGLYPIYDPILDPGDETRGLRLPGVRRDNLDGTFAVDYDIPLAIYDCALDDGVTPHQDFHNGCGETHPEQWGKTFFRHLPNHGFVGDIFTVNGVAYPVLHVKRRKYRFRFLDASISRVYEFMLMSSTGGPQAAPGSQGQYQLPDGQQSMQFTQIASEGGLLPCPVVRNSFTVWPSKRREFIVDFTRFMDGSPCTKGDCIYLVNIAKMSDGRKPDSTDPNFKVPVLKIVIDGDAPDQSLIPPRLRELPDINLNVPHRTFDLQRGGVPGDARRELELVGPNAVALAEEFEWLVNDRPFNACMPLAFPRKDHPEIWTIKSGGGWGHPMHFHQEEHQVLSRNGVPTPRPTPGTCPVLEGPQAEDLGKEDTVALNGSETVVIYRNFRTFPAAGFPEARYVAHCHQLAHEDHSMMFGWTIVP
jgi:FtsP/CotA-like multicopper oxidase with cupredoxin domain